MIKRSAAILLGLAMALFPVAAMAADEAPADSQTRGDYSVDEFVDESYVGSGVRITNEFDPEGIGPNTIPPKYDAVAAARQEVEAGQEAADNKAGASRKKGASKVDATSYTYRITPLLEPFNQFFFVQTDNPDPRTFRFADKSSVYSEESTIALDWDSWDDEIQLYADIQYENESIGRVNGGYIFYSGDTDGGNVTLQVNEEPDSWYSSWEDTGKKISLPALKDSVDYLIDTYATPGGNFFDNMDAVQSGFSSICLYSGSYIRGTLNKTSDYWSLAGTPHIDQHFYIYSPYERDDNRALFASAIYPYRYDSLGFPGMMGAVSRELDSSSSYEWNSSSHAYIDVTYNGETRTYGGQGNGEGQGISDDKILQYFTFGDGGTEITLDGGRALLQQYAAIPMDDDIPREDALTWKQIYDTVGDGAWVRLSGGSSYAYLYQKGDGTSFNADEWGVGNSTYWSGDLGYASGCWVDGRFVSPYERYYAGVKFEDEPTADILLKDVTIPQIKYTYKWVRNPDTGQSEVVYEPGEISEETKTVRFVYQEEYGVWTPAYPAFGSRCADYERIAAMVESGLLDEKYLDMASISQDEIPALQLDRNTNAVPDKGFIFDGYYPPGTPFDESVDHCWGRGQVTTKAGCETEGAETVTCLVCGETKTRVIPPIGHKWGEPTYKITRDFSKMVATRTCENDSSHVEKETVQTIPKVTVEPTCEQPGEMIYRGVFENPAFSPKRKTVELPALGHSWDDGVITLYPTADADGERTFTCGNCGKTRTEAIPRDIDEITPAEEMADAAPVDADIPVINTGKIQTVGNITKKQMKVKFPVDGAVDNYRIQYRTSESADWTNAWSAGTNSYMIKGLKKYSLCEFRIAGYVKQPDGSWARGDWSKSAYRYMGAAALKSAKAGKKSMTLTWAKDKKCSGYQIQYSLKSNMSKAKTITVSGKNKTKYTVKKLKSGKKYYVKIRPIKKSSGKVYIGILTKAKTVKVK